MRIDIDTASGYRVTKVCIQLMDTKTDDMQMIDLETADEGAGSFAVIETHGKVSVDCSELVEIANMMKEL